MTQSYFRDFLKGHLYFNWKLGVWMILLFGIPRFILVLSANKTGDYSLISVIFILMWIAPFVLLNREGRRQIGIKKAKNSVWFVYALIAGLLGSGIIYYLGDFLYGDTISNWFVYISNSYGTLPDVLSDSDRMIYFFIFAVTSMTFSPIGEELVYRGLIHESFTHRFGETGASVVDSLAFAVTHLAHFGIIYSLESYDFLPVPAFIWVSLMFLASRLFYFTKLKSGSLLGPILCHAGFNFGMTYFIFYHIL